MLIVCHDYASAKVRPSLGHPWTNLRLKGATNLNFTGEEPKKELHQRSSDNIDSQAENSNDFDQDTTITQQAGYSPLTPGLKPT